MIFFFPARCVTWRFVRTWHFNILSETLNHHLSHLCEVQNNAGTLYLCIAKLNCCKLHYWAHWKKSLWAKQEFKVAKNLTEHVYTKNCFHQLWNPLKELFKNHLCAVKLHSCLHWGNYNEKIFLHYSMKDNRITILTSAEQLWSRDSSAWCGSACRLSSQRAGIFN